MSYPLTSIVILTMNEVELTQACIASIEQHTPEPYELIMVDNGSTDGTHQFLDSLDATCIFNDSNLGFGGGCNQGIAASRGERILFLNNDTVVTPGWLSAMHNVLDKHPDVGLVGPRSNYVSGPQNIDACSYDETSLSGLDAFAHERSKAHSGTGMILPRLVGFCLLARREVMERIGGFDIRFRMGNFEDDDICVRARVAGWTCWMANDSFVHHVGNRTFIAAGIDYRATMQENWLRYSRKWDLNPADIGRYDAARIADRQFDLTHDYAPIVAALPRGERVALDASTTTVLFAADPLFAADTSRDLRSSLEALRRRDDVTLVVRIDPNDTTTLPALELAADAVGDAQLCDIVVVTHSALNDQAVVEACDVVLVHGVRGFVMDGLAQYCQRRSIGISDLDHLVTHDAAA